jgi:DNA-binding SARP family transcriptional activator/tetratricopeptide (TPR) repeat protein
MTTATASRREPANTTERDSADVCITLLGGFAVTVDGVRLDDGEWRRRQAAALVKILALASGRTLHREQLVDMLWPNLSVEEAAPRLHKAAHFARRALHDPESVILAGDAVRLFPTRRVRVDAIQFETLAVSALAAADRGAASRAADTYTGELLPQDPYEDWAIDTRDRMHLLYLDVLRLGRRWQLLAAADPTDEQAHLALIAEMTQRGDRHSALRQFERLERALRRELGVTPSDRALSLRDELAREADTAVTVSPRPVDDARHSALPTLVGRGGSERSLSAVLDTAQFGRGRTLFLSGPGGVGKTALLGSLQQTAASRGWRVGSGVAARIAGAWPYAPVLEALADLCRRHPALLDGLDDTLKAEIENALSGRDIAWTAQSGHQRLFVAAAELLRLAAAGTGALLIVDDAHHADDASLRLLHYLARATFTERTVIVFAHRPSSVPATLAEVRQSLESRGTAVTHVLHPLTRAETTALVYSLSPGSGRDFVEAVWTASGGLPYTVVALARSEAAGSSAGADSTSLPSLTEGQMRVCAQAAVLGMTFDTDEFVAVSAMSEDEAYGVLDTAVAHDLLDKTEVGYAFRHSMVRESLLGGLLPSQARDAHRRAAAALQALDRSPSRIGHHLTQAGDQASALAWMLRAAETSAAMGANQEALATLDSVRERARGADLVRLLSLRADLLMGAADAGAVNAYREALTVAHAPADRSRLRARLARAAMLAGDLDTASVALEGLPTEGSAPDADVLLAQGTLALFLGDVAAADLAAREARRRVVLGRPDDWQMFDVIGLQGLIAHNRGEWFERLRLELRQGAEHPALAARIFDSHLCVAEYLLYGPTPYPEVVELATALQATAERSGVLRAVAFAMALRGETALLMGDLPTAENDLREAADLHHDIGSPAGEAHSLQRLAEVRLAVGDPAGADRLLRRALTLGRFTSIAGHLLQRVYGTMITAASNPSAARAIVDDADAALGVSDRCPFCTVMLALPAARACAEVGDMDDARRHLHDAEVSARMWEGTAWQAAILETKASLAAAEGHLDAAAQLRGRAADMFEVAGQPLDARRCRRT